MKSLISIIVAILLAGTFVISSCSKNEPSLPPSVVQFSNSSCSLSEFGVSSKVSISFSTPLQNDGNLSISISDSTAVYGKDYITSPAADSKTLTIPLTKGATMASFTITAVQKSLTDGDVFANFLITGLPKATQLGSVLKLKATIIDDDLVCYLPMNENAKDASHYANKTMVEGASLTTGRKTLSNTAYQMDGISNDIVITNNQLLDTLSQITLTAWIKPVSFYGVGNNAIIEKAFSSHTNPYYQYKLGITGDQRTNLPGSFVFGLSVNGNYQYVATGANAWTPGNWYFVVGTYDGKAMVLYINGNSVATIPASGKIDHWGKDIYLGQLKNLSSFTPGTFGDIRIYNRALSVSEINGLYIK